MTRARKSSNQTDNRPESNTEPTLEWVTFNRTIPSDGTRFGSPNTLFLASEGWDISLPTPDSVRLKRGDVHMIVTPHAVVKLSV